MNRKRLVIFALTGIIITVLALMGFTYGYYMSQIYGNESSKSVTLIAGESKLKYVDLSVGNVNTTIGVGYTNTRFFAVQNIGNLEASYYIALVDVINEFIRQEDIVYTLYRKSGDTSIDPEDFKTKDVDLSTWEVISDDTDSCPISTTYTEYGDCQYPGVVSLIKNTPETITTKNNYYIYALKVTYINQSGVSQEEDQGHIFSGRIKISADQYVTPYDEGTLAEAIYKNAAKGTNGTTLGNPLTTVAEMPSASTYGKTNPTMYPSTRSSATNYYIAYACDYTIDTSGNFTLGTDECPVTTMTSKYVYTEDLRNSLAGKFAYWSTNAISSTTGLSELYKITEDTTKITTSSIDYITLNKYVSTEKVLASTEDDYGVSYYFRGGVEDNYVNFAGMCWRIVRIDGEDSVKLVLEDQDSECESSDGNWNIPTTTGGTQLTGNFGYTKYSSGGLTDSAGNLSTSTLYIMDYLGGTTNSSSSLATALKNFQTGKLSNYLTKLKSGNWCYNDTAYANSSYTDMSTAVPLTSDEKLTKYVSGTDFYYDSYVRLYGNTTKSPTLKCPTDVEGESNILTNFTDGTDMYVGALTADEIAFSGGKSGSSNYAYYLLNDYQRGKGLHWWALSPNNFDGDSGRDFAFYVYGSGLLVNYYVYFNGPSFRPAVTLTSSVIVTDGVGTIYDPYIIG